MHDHTSSPSVDTRDAAAYTDFSTALFRKWRRNGDGPAYYKIGRSIRYRISDLDAFLNAHRVEPKASR